MGASEESVGALWAASGAGSREARGPRGPEAGVLEGPDSGRVGREWCPAVVVRALDELRLDAGGVVRLQAPRFAGRGGCGERDDAALPPAALRRVSALFEAAGRLSALVALLVSGLVQGLVSPAHVLLICGLLVLVAFLGTALRSASVRERDRGAERPVAAHGIMRVSASVVASRPHRVCALVWRAAFLRGKTRTV